MEKSKFENQAKGYEAEVDQPEEIRRSLGALAVSGDALDLGYLKAQLEEAQKKAA